MFQNVHVNPRLRLTEVEWSLELTQELPYLALSDSNVQLISSSLTKYQHILVYVINSSDIITKLMQQLDSKCKTAQNWTTLALLMLLLSDKLFVYVIHSPVDSKL